MYRLVRERGETGDRRRHATHPPRVKPELLATRPNQCWSWDITKLAGPAKWTWFYLYVILDLYSRYAVGWMVATGRPPPWPSGCWPTPSPPRAWSPASSPSTLIGAPR
jgi:transposase InsO family protein